MKVKEFFTGTQEEQAAKETARALEVQLSHARKPNKGKIQRYHEAKRLGNRPRGRAAALITALTVTAGIGVGAANISSKEKSGPDKPEPQLAQPAKQNSKSPGFGLRIYNPKFFGEKRMTAITDAAKEWDRQYQCNRQVIVTPYTQYEKSSDSRGHTFTTFETTTPGHIQLGRQGSAYDVVLHAMTHACKTDRTTPIDPPVEYGDGSSIAIGVNGLTIDLQSTDGKITTSKNIEEAMAERNAALASPIYRVTNLGYYTVGKHMIQTTAPFRDAETWTQNNDLTSFVDAELGLPKGTPLNSQNLTHVIDEYDQMMDRRTEP